MKKTFWLFLIVIALFAINKDLGAVDMPISSATSSEDILLVNANNPLPRNYRATNLINLYEQRSQYFQLAQMDIEIAAEVYSAMERMFEAANRDGLDGFIISSGYRTRAKQQEIHKTSKKGLAAKPGESEHETGLAFDVITIAGQDRFVDTLQYKWLLKNCGKYGFILRYPKGAESITGFSAESWHYRYVGLPHSEVIMDTGITLEEYLQELT